MIDEQVDAVRTHGSRQVWAMVLIQRLTGMRPAEVVAMRSCGLDVTADIWRYVPELHKTQRHGHQRTIYIGPRAREILQPRVGGKINASGQKISCESNLTRDMIRVGISTRNLD